MLTLPSLVEVAHQPLLNTRGPLEMNGESDKSWQTKLEEVQRLYERWLTGELPTEDFLFQLGDILAENSDGAEPG